MSLYITFVCFLTASLTITRTLTLISLRREGTRGLKFGTQTQGKHSKLIFFQPTIFFSKIFFNKKLFSTKIFFHSNLFLTRNFIYQKSFRTKYNSVGCQKIVEKVQKGAKSAANIEKSKLIDFFNNFLAALVLNVSLLGLKSRSYLTGVRH